MLFFKQFRLQRIDRKICATERQLAWLRTQHCPLGRVSIHTLQEKMNLLQTQREKISH